MLTRISYYRFHLRRICCLLVLVCCCAGARSQDAVNMVRMSQDRLFSDRLKVKLPATLQSFDYSSRLIHFTAEVDGVPGHFLLDTGAPQLLMNDRGRRGQRASVTGHGAGGELALSETLVETFTLSGLEYTNLWSLSLDLRPVEQRLERTIDGLVGYDLLRNGELRINYRSQIFQLLESRRAPTHRGREPDHVLPFRLSDHLPVITVKVGKRKLRLALDTGASVNALSTRHRAPTSRTTEEMNIQGLDGSAQILPVATLQARTTLPAAPGSPPTEFVLIDLNELEGRAGSPDFHGILGSRYLENFTVGIDYRRNRIYLWNQTD